VNIDAKENVAIFISLEDVPPHENFKIRDICKRKQSSFGLQSLNTLSKGKSKGIVDEKSNSRSE